MTNSNNWSYHLVFIFELGLMSHSQHHYQVRDIELRVESSPCIWGALHEIRDQDTSVRITPIYIGNTLRKD